MRRTTFTSRLFCLLLAIFLHCPQPVHALRAPQIKNDSPALSGLEENLGGPPGETDPEHLALAWKSFILKTYDTLNGFHGSWLDKLWVGFLVKKPREKIPLRLKGGLPRGVLGGVHVPLVRLFEQLNGLTPKIAEEEYRQVKGALGVRIHALEEIQAEVSRALARVLGPERQRELLHLRNGTVAEYQWALASFKGLLENWRDRFDALAAGPLAPAETGLEEGAEGPPEWRGDEPHRWRAFGGTTAIQLLRFLEWRRDNLRVAQLEGNGNGEAPDAVGWFSRDQTQRLIREAPDWFLLVENRRRRLGLLDRGSGELYHELVSRSLSNIVVVPLTLELITRHEEHFEYLLGQLGLWVGGRVERYLRGRDLRAEFSFAAMDPLTQEIPGFISANRGDARRERSESSSVYVNYNVVDESYRSGGVGRLLLEAVLQAADQVPEVNRVYLDSLTHSDTQRFYGMLGAQRVRVSKGMFGSTGNRVRYQFVLRTPEEIQAQRDLEENAPDGFAAGLEEPADGAMKKLDGQAFAELEALLRSPGVPRRVPVSVEEITRGGAKVVYRGKEGGVARGFLPVGATFLDDEHFVSIEAKLTWLRQRARLAEPLDVFPEGIGHSRRDDAPLMVFRLDRVLGPDLFEEEPVFQDQVIASEEVGRIWRFLSWLAESGSDPTERLVQMYYLGAWGRLWPGQAAEVIEWLAKNVRPGQGRALFLLFHDLVRSSLTTKRGRIEWFKTQEAALRGVVAAAPFAGPKAEALEAIQGLWTLVDKGWAAETKARALGHLQYAARRLGTKVEVGAGLEEVRRYESVEAFLEAYREDLRASGMLGRVETILRERKLPYEVWVVPNQAVTQQRIRVYALAEDPSEQAEWEVAVQERLNRERDRLQGVLFEVEPYPADGRLQTDLPSIVVRQTGAFLGAGGEPLVPVVTLSIVSEVELLNPSWIYSLAVNRSLDGIRVGPLLDAIPVEDGFALFV